VISTDIVGLYMNPPVHAIVLSLDEKSPIQALDRTQPGLPLKPGQMWNHDLRLKAPWDDHAVRGAQRVGRHGDWMLQAAAPP
jgi:hypothetical protein